MRLKILTAFLLAAIFGGCAAFRGKVYILEDPKVKEAYSAIELPYSIKIDGETFTRKYKNLAAAYYFLNGEEGFGWSKLVSISYFNDVKNIDEYAYGIYQAIEEANAGKKQEDRRSFGILKTNHTQAIIVLLNPPAPGDPHFNKYEVDLMVADMQSCGLVLVQYAKNFDSDRDFKKMRKFIKENKAKILPQMPKIKCR
nr:hypothetical protein [uncultured Campylobacter sp.]